MSATTTSYDADAKSLAEQMTIDNNSNIGTETSHETLSDWIDTDSSSDNDEEARELYNNIHYHPVNLVAFERLHNQTPIYSRSLLLQIRRQQQTILHETRLPKAESTVQHLTWQSPDGQITRVWKKDPKQKKQEPIGRVKVHYMPRVAFDRGFQRKYGSLVDLISSLREYKNGDAAIKSGRVEQMHFDAPYALSTVSQWKEVEHRDAELMQRYRDAIARSWEFWENSDTCRRRFTKTIEYIKATSPPVKRIVCFGLGEVELNWIYDVVFQHIFVFSIAKTLNKCYEETGKKQGKIQILLQESCYEKRDWTLFSELHQAMGCEASSEIQFVDDPDGLLAIDSNTMIVAPHLPIRFPWPQIVADLFAAGSGPAVIIGDHLVAKREKEAFTLSDRGSPAVARFLSDRYVRLQRGSEGDKHKLDLPAEMAECTREAVDWFSRMDLYVRRREDA